jgi:hypothetical protein
VANLGAMRARIARELQIDATTYASEIDDAIFTAIRRYHDKDFWFLDATQLKFTLTATTHYSMTTALRGRSDLKTLSLHINGAKEELIYRTLEEILALDFDEDYTGDPLYWHIDGDQLMIYPKPRRTFTAEAYFTSRASLTASASASNVWTSEGEELIRITAEIDILRNRIKDYDEADRKMLDLRIAKAAIDEQTVQRKSLGRIKPWM